MGIGVSILLIATGAVLAFAVNVATSASGIDIHTVGVILMVVGGLGLAVSMMFWSSWGGFGSGRHSVPGGGGNTTTIVD